MFARLVAAAAIAGLAGGLLLTLLQQLEVVPLIRQAEAFEAAHAHAPHLWATAIANVVLATGFALFLAAGMAMRRSAGWRAGIAWGIAGYAAFFVAPALGLPPELPGTEAAPLGARQLWWIAAVSCAVAGFALVAFARPRLLRALGIVIILAPHLFGAPEHALQPANASADLAASFVRATYVVNAIFWVVLGSVAGWVLSAPSRGPRKAA